LSGFVEDMHALGRKPTARRTANPSPRPSDPRRRSLGTSARRPSYSCGARRRSE
jgi:hypothetical protein